MDRRSFLRGGLVLGCTAAAFPLMTPVAFASAPWENRLVVIVLRGAMDGLDAVQPLGDGAFAGLRPRIGTGGAPIGSGFWGRHDGLATLDPLWAAAELGYVHAVSTPYRDERSHFDGQDILEAGTPTLGPAGRRDGWLNRMMQTVPGLTAETAYAIGREQMLILTGEAEVARWAPDAQLRLSPATRSLLEYVHHDDPLVRSASAEAIAIVDELAEEAAAGGPNGFRRDHIGLAQFAASRLRRDSRIASFSLGGWDTHANQSAGIGRGLTRLSETILALREAMAADWGRTAVLCMTEFGRTARENGAGGTDHGTGGAMILAGGAVRGGRVVADWPGLAEADLYDRRDLMPTRDVRAHAGWIMRGLFGLDRAVIEGAVFPGVELGPDPGLLL